MQNSQMYITKLVQIQSLQEIGNVEKLQDECLFSPLA